MKSNHWSVPGRALERFSSSAKAADGVGESLMTVSLDGALQQSPSARL
jgi:hypothetical protein